eukprot:1489878-Amphidinium_carterae.1
MRCRRGIYSDVCLQRKQPTHRMGSHFIPVRASCGRVVTAWPASSSTEAFMRRFLGIQQNRAKGRNNTKPNESKTVSKASHSGLDFTLAPQ